MGIVYEKNRDVLLPHVLKMHARTVYTFLECLAHCDTLRHEDLCVPTFDPPYTDDIAQSPTLVLQFGRWAT